jgi:hypothetical protein
VAVAIVAAMAGIATAAGAGTAAAEIVTEAAAAIVAEAVVGVTVAVAVAVAVAVGVTAAVAVAVVIEAVAAAIEADELPASGMPGTSFCRPCRPRATCSLPVDRCGRSPLGWLAAPGRPTACRLATWNRVEGAPMLEDRRGHVMHWPAGTARPPEYGSGDATSVPG